MVRPTPISHHAIRDILSVAERCRTAGPTVGASTPTGVATPVCLIGARTRMSCGVVIGNALLDDGLPDQSGGRRLIDLLGERWKGQRQSKKWQV
jgi:hypothetical protein